MMGIYLFAVFSEWASRRSAFFVWFGLGCVVIPAFFWGVAFAPNMVLPASLDGVLFTLSFAGWLPKGAISAVQVAVFFAFFLGFATRVAGGIPIAATVVAGVYILGFIGAALGPETKSKPLPE